MILLPAGEISHLVTVNDFLFLCTTSGHYTLIVLASMVNNMKSQLCPVVQCSRAQCTLSGPKCKMDLPFTSYLYFLSANIKVLSLEAKHI